MIQVIIFDVCICSNYDYATYYYSKTFPKTATIKEIEDWIKSHNEKLTIFDAKFATVE